MGTNDRPIEDKAGPQRSCILTRNTADKDRLIRLALGPDGQVAPDVRARAPGRGAYIGVGKADLDAAEASGQLKAALARAFKSGKLQIPAGLGDMIADALRQQTLDRLGLEARGGTLLNGAEKVEAACRSGKARLLLHAADASEDGRKKLDAAWRVGGGEEFGMSRGLVFPENRTILSGALGRENVVHVALIDAKAAKRVKLAISRWQSFLELDAGVEGASSSSPTGTTHDGRNEG